MSSADRYRMRRRSGELACLVALAALASGCWLEPTQEPPPFDCANIDRAEERFPVECGDGGVPMDADVDAGP